MGARGWGVEGKDKGVWDRTERNRPEQGWGDRAITSSEAGIKVNAKGVEGVVQVARNAGEEAEYILY